MRTKVVVLDLWNNMRLRREIMRHFRIGSLSVWKELIEAWLLNRVVQMTRRLSQHFQSSLLRSCVNCWGKIQRIVRLYLVAFSFRCMWENVLLDIGVSKVIKTEDDLETFFQRHGRTQFGQVLLHVLHASFWEYLKTSSTGVCISI